MKLTRMFDINDAITPAFLSETVRDESMYTVAFWANLRSSRKKSNTSNLY